MTTRRAGVSAAVRRDMDLQGLGTNDLSWLVTFDDYVTRKANGRLPVEKTRHKHLPSVFGAGVPAAGPAHEMVLMMKSGSNNVFRVRCKCMAETTNAPSSWYRNYDWISEVSTAEEAVVVYREHLQTGAKRVVFRRT